MSAGPVTLDTAIADDRAAFTAALRTAVDRMDPSSAAIASYHLGWTEADGRPGAGSGGKAVRPVLAMLSARAAGAPTSVGLPGAVAVELVHNFSLLHDDLMDGDLERRHRPTVWAVFGVPAAILAGDAMLALATEVLLDGRAQASVAAAALLADATRELIRGQFEDVSFERRSTVTLAECLTMAAGKTGALLQASAGIGAVLAAAPDPVVHALTAFGRHLGLAFQLEDDLLGIWGDSAVTGKPVLADLRSRKKSLPVTAALGDDCAAARELATWLARPRVDGVVDHEDELHRVAGLVEQAGGRDWARRESQVQLQLAEDALDAVELDEAARRDLLALGRSLLGRSS